MTKSRRISMYGLTLVVISPIWFRIVSIFNSSFMDWVPFFSLSILIAGIALAISGDAKYRRGSGRKPLFALYFLLSVAALIIWSVCGPPVSMVRNV